MRKRLILWTDTPTDIIATTEMGPDGSPVAWGREQMQKVLVRPSKAQYWLEISSIHMELDWKEERWKLR